MSRLPYLVLGCSILFGVAFRIDVTRASQARSGTASDLSVTFVGCKSDGQAGSLETPTNPGIDVQLDSTIARRLSIYKAAVGDAILGPRGWFCFATYGSGGATLYITPEPLKPASAPKSFWDQITGPITGSAIQASVLYGDTSGRYAVAEIAARVFPTQRSLALNLLAEAGMQIPSRPYPGDRLTYVNERIVEYETPGRAQGLGTSVSGGRLQQNVDSIRGVAILEPGFFLHHLAVRLPQKMIDLAPHVIRQFEATH
ncbi:MAG TPA: hypothetical protein VGK48_09500 [Terriglobia bacterium]